MAELPERLPHPPPVLQPRVLHEVGLADVAADGREEVHERLQRGGIVNSLHRISVPARYVSTAGQAQGARDLHTIAKPSALRTGRREGETGRKMPPLSLLAEALTALLPLAITGEERKREGGTVGAARRA